jgi:hypothetical protein
MNCHRFTGYSRWGRRGKVNCGTREVLFLCIILTRGLTWTVLTCSSKSPSRSSASSPWPPSWTFSIQVKRSFHFTGQTILSLYGSNDPFSIRVKRSFLYTGQTILSLYRSNDPFSIQVKRSFLLYRSNDRFDLFLMIKFDCNLNKVRCTGRITVQMKI